MPTPVIIGQTVAGQLTRRPRRGCEYGEQEWARRLKMPLLSLLDLVHVGPDLRADAMTVWCEAIANAYRHARASRIRYFASVDPRQIRLLLVYPTLPFDTNPPLPGGLSESGRGICIMRAMCADTNWHFASGRLWLALVLTSGQGFLDLNN